MKKQCLKSLILGLLIIFFSFSPNYNVKADSNSMTVSPPYQKISLTPGESYQDSLIISNASDSTRDLKYKIDIGSFNQKKAAGSTAKDDYDDIDHISISSYNQIMGWISFNSTSGTVAPGEMIHVPYTINVPKDAPGGGQYATILVIDDASQGSGGEGNIAIENKYQFASIIYADVAGETRTEGKITENHIPTIIFSNPLEATSMVKNNGNVHTDAKYTLQVWPLFSDEELCTNAEDPETSLILPDTERYHVQSCELPAFGLFKVKQTVNIFDESSVVESTVFICPLWVLFVTIFGIILIIFWLIAKIRARKHRRHNQTTS